MADRFQNGDPANDTGGLGGDPLVSGFDPTKKGFYNGGDLDGPALASSTTSRASAPTRSG